MELARKFIWVYVPSSGKTQRWTFGQPNRRHDSETIGDSRNSSQEFREESEHPG